MRALMHRALDLQATIKTKLILVTLDAIMIEASRRESTNNRSTGVSGRCVEYQRMSKRKKEKALRLLLQYCGGKKLRRTATSRSVKVPSPFSLSSLQGLKSSVPEQSNAVLFPCITSSASRDIESWNFSVPHPLPLVCSDMYVRRTCPSRSQ